MPAARMVGLMAGVLFLVSGCTNPGDTKPHHNPRHERNYPALHDSATVMAMANNVLMRAIGLVGTPYRYGGNTPTSGFDCSGLVDFVFRDAANLLLPRTTQELIDFDAPEIDRNDLNPGDLVFFSPTGGAVSHIGIYVGEGRFVHAPREGGTVRLESLTSDYWHRAYRGARRVLR